ncbi:uncharacterized protein SPAPADRAFT_60942 [Spathaspora passalidarum NRRL Y-27907]|uniref:Uncharacterized protein n=1 Tax=Spathaspora passalidarum (strain NRRL Y-27907 / 11-Y1) TaxID=619300 RepID=G3AKK3_SPAPN|nr:uncharacterized protein SPAPADRAFT_60942 [Spathaspora passalidarum NRRL Y-27907]EGW33608.1 hypothetical protein SPAPADRAFT_60942 [Spathaspora passalidarum NRRL Y-27907]
MSSPPLSLQRICVIRLDQKSNAKVSSKKGIDMPMLNKTIIRTITTSYIIPQYPRPNFISFDLFDTLYTPKQSVPLTYYKIATDEFNIRHKSLEAINKELPIVYNEVFMEYPNYGKGVLKSWDCWWRELIIRLFQLERNDQKTQALCDRLIQFYSGEAYRVYDDVIPTLDILTRNNVKLVITSNSDYRVFEILKYLNLIDYFNHEDIFLSYDVGYVKPSIDFFNVVVETMYKQQYGKDAGIPDKTYRNNCFHIGDSHDKDFIGCIASGWNGIYLQRDENSYNEDLISMTNDDRMIISNLTCLPTVFQL